MGGQNQNFHAVNFYTPEVWSIVLFLESSIYIQLYCFKYSPGWKFSRLFQQSMHFYLIFQYCLDLDLDLLFIYIHKNSKYLHKG